MVVLAVASSCSEAETFVDAKFETPTAMTVAGIDGKRLFVANAGTGHIQVIELDDDLRESTPVF